MRIQSDKLTQLIRNSELGTGTLSKVAKIHPDELQKLIALSEGSKELVERVEGILGEPFHEGEETGQATDAAPTSPAAGDICAEQGANVSEKPSPIPGVKIVQAHTVNEIMALVESGEWAPAPLLEAEKATETPRTSLLNWLEERATVKE